MRRNISLKGRFLAGVRSCRRQEPVAKGPHGALQTIRQCQRIWRGLTAPPVMDHGQNAAKPDAIELCASRRHAEADG
jgi:hypothetical protein